MIRVVVVDDQELVRRAFAVLLSLAPDIDVVGEAADGLEAVSVVRSQRPDVVLMDVRMPRMDGLEASRILAADETTGACRIVILTTFDLDEYVFEALRAGASGFLLKDTGPDDLVAAVRVIAAGESLLAPTVTRRLIEEFVRRPGPAPSSAVLLEELTAREREVLTCVARGCSNAEIAEELHMSHGTVKTHVSHLLTKLRCRDRAQLVMVAYETGAAVPGEQLGS